MKSADVLCNLTELNDDIEKEGIDVFNRFNATKKDTLSRYQKLIPEIINTWDKNPLISDLESGLNKLLDLIK